MPARCRPTQAAVAVIGGGASGTLAAAHVARAAARRGAPTEIVLIEPGRAGRGVAYSTTDPRHRLNVPAANMSAWPDEPEDFLRWLRRHVSVQCTGEDFASRRYFGDYLGWTLEHAVRTARDVTLTHVPARATAVRRHGRRLRVTLDDGTSRAVDAVVLAHGYDTPAPGWAPPELLHSPRFVADPWSGGEDIDVPAGGAVLIVGAGLTAADMAMRWGRAGVRVHLVSRHGLQPLPHAPAAAIQLDPPAGLTTLAALRRYVFTEIRRAGGDWRAVVDALRPHSTRLWAALPEDQKRLFTRTTARRWDRLRHRLAPDVHAWLAERAAERSLVVHTGEVVAADDRAGAVTVQLSDGTRLEAAAVLNCTGTTVDVRANADPLVLNLLESGAARPGPLGLGFATDGTGRLSADQPSAIWAIGPLRRGELWESTAVPEIRVQAAALAGEVVAALPSPRLVRRPRDQYGLPLSSNAAAAALFTEAVGRILRVQSGSEALLCKAVRADPDFALGHAVLAMLGAEWGVDVDVTAALADADRCAVNADERERRFVEVAAARVQQPGPDSAAALLSYIQNYPEDALAVSLAVPTIAFGGATEVPAEAWALIESLQPIYRNDWWYRSMLAFTRQEQERYDEAAELAADALAVEPASGHAVHAKTHVHYETGDHRAGLRWLDGWINACGATASHRAHFSWHAALHELALGDDDAVRSRYASQLAAPHVTGMRALVDSASLLWRGYTAGAWGRPDMQPVLAVVPRALVLDPPTPFAALHAAIALAAAGDCRGLAALRRAAERRPEPVFADTVAPLADALCDLTHDDADRALEGLQALTGVEKLGGSAAQREIVEDTLLYCAVRARRFDVAVDVLQARLDRRPSPRDQARAGELAAAASRSRSSEAASVTAAPRTA